LYCSTCGDDRLFEQPPCPDGHGPDCPERFCVDCGAAVLVGPLATAPGRAEHPGDPSTAHPTTPGRAATRRAGSRRAVA
jgi:hypothetical protein